MEIDPRGPRFGAVITAVVMGVALVTAGTPGLAATLLALQAAVFAVGALAGLRYAPYGLVYRRLIRPRIGPPEYTEPQAPPRFSQGVGLVFATLGVIAYAAGVNVLGIVFTAIVLAAAFLSAAFDFCLGCQAYLFIQRMRPAVQRPTGVQ